ncbi:hypothetical protein GQ600_1551 [Phytophthora cactorum]|nr:hypothetical protein GQ600_1551 [Phytophthora cactorum]
MILFLHEGYPHLFGQENWERSLVSVATEPNDEHVKKIFEFSRARENSLFNLISSCAGYTLFLTTNIQNRTKC